MNLPIRFVIPGRPITKKNSMRMVHNGGRVVPIPSKQFAGYQASAGRYIPCKYMAIDYPVNVQCLYFMPTKGRVDLPNLLNATDDILVHYGVLVDDNSDIVAGHDGSHVIKGCKDMPRVEIEIRAIEEEAWKIILP